MIATVERLTKTLVTKKVLLTFLTLLVLFMLPVIFGMLLVGSLIMFLPHEQAPSTDLTDTEWIITADGKRLIPAQYVPIYEKIGKEYGVPWNLLAAIHKVETDFGRNLSVSSAGAVGHFQSMPCNWLGWDYYAAHCDRHGNFLPGYHIDLTNPRNLHGGQAVDENHDGKIDPNNVYDSMATAAKRLAADKARTRKGWFDEGGPIWRYNPSQAYVDEVKKYFYLFATAKNPSVVAAANLIYKGGKFPWPTLGHLTAPFGEVRPGHIHKGIDIGAPIGTPIYAEADGVVTRSKSDPGGFGWYIVINHGDLNGRQIETWYGHMYENTVKVHVGEKVKKGQIIAAVGSNGHSTGPHLHFEVHVNGTPVNPLSWIGR